MAATYEVAIVGAGPAGSSLARLLAERGVSVLLIDKARFPRPKPCAGGISPKAIRHLGGGIDGVRRVDIRTAVISYRSSREVVCSSSQPLGWTVDRARFDARLVETAVAAGAQFRDGLRVGRVDRTAEGWETGAGGQTFRSRFLVGADGAASLVARVAGLRYSDWASSIETTVSFPGRGRGENKEQVRFDFGQVDSGYAWVFSKSGHVSVGVYSTRLLSGRALGAALEAFIWRERTLEGGEASRPRRWLIPRGASRHRTLHFPGGLLVGDAAGLADPLTGEGVGPALHSAEIASRVLIESLEGRAASLESYSREVDRVLRPSFRRARVCASLAYRNRGRLVGRFVRSGFAERLWERLARGEVSYPRLAWGLLALAAWLPFGALGRPLGRAPGEGAKA